MSLTVDANLSIACNTDVKTFEGGKAFTNSVYTVKNPEGEPQTPVRGKVKTGKKSEQYKQELIDKYGKEYTITVEKQDDMLVYCITVNKKIDLKSVRKELGIKPGVIRKYNDKTKYDTYGTLNNGSYVDDGPMENEIFIIPVDELGYTHDERTFFEWVLSAFD